MKVFKFGGASVKDAPAIKNLADIVNLYKESHLLIVVSAMGKTTNALEEILLKAYRDESYSAPLNKLKQYHQSIIQELLPKENKETADSVNALFETIPTVLNTTLTNDNFSLLYDRIISLGELASTRIVSDYLNAIGLKCQWMDARELIRTDSTFREAIVNWEYTCLNTKRKLKPLLNESLVLTQGFIGADVNNNTTTLGREGSDFSAAILAFCLDAKEVVIWKDVEGVLNADPKRMPSAVLYTELPYQEAAEMTYYGATVIHPKTIKPLANKKIPLWVKPFGNLSGAGTCIHDCSPKKLPPAIIFKPNQCLLSFRTKDLSFVDEHHLSHIFQVVDSLNIKLNLMQNSATSFSICIDQNANVPALIESLKPYFDIYFNETLELITVKNYDNTTIESISQNNKILLEQRTRNNFQIVVSHPDKAIRITDTG